MNTVVPLPSGPTGFVEVDTLGIKGAWYPYGDGIGPDALPADSNCVLAGHMASECSTITQPVPTDKTFTNTNSIMCTSGTVAKVINLTGMTGCPATTTACDYSAMFGAGIGVDLNNGGLDGGIGKQPFNAQAAGVIGIAFDVVDMTGAPADVPLTGLRIEFPTPTTTTTAAIWKWQMAKNFTSPVVKGHNVILFTEVTQPSYVPGYMAATAALDVTNIVSVQFHVPTTTSATGPYSFCIGNFSAITNGSTPVSGTAGASGTAGSSGAGTAGASAGTGGAGTAGAGTGGAGTAGAGTAGAGTAGAGTAGAGTAGAGTAGAGTAGAGTAGAAQ